MPEQAGILPLCRRGMGESYRARWVRGPGGARLPDAIESDNDGQSVDDPAGTAHAPSGAASVWDEWHTPRRERQTSTIGKEAVTGPLMVVAVVAPVWFGYRAWRGRRPG